MINQIHGLQLITINKDLVAIGGSIHDFLPSLLHRLSCKNKECWWQTLSTQLTIGRMQFVTILIPDDTVDCDGK